MFMKNLYQKYLLKIVKLQVINNLKMILLINRKINYIYNKNKSLEKFPLSKIIFSLAAGTHLSSKKILKKHIMKIQDNIKINRF